MVADMAPRALDHLVLPVFDIDVARARYEALGFTVAPDGKHPFGTENCCVFFDDGTFLEPLAIAHRETCEEAMLKGNTFVSNDQTYRFRRGQEGFSHLVIKSDDAHADHTMYRKQAISGGRKVRFKRKFETPSGDKGVVKFKLAFAADKRAPDAGFFSCQVLSTAAVDRSALKRHANGVTGLKAVVMAEPNPSDFQYFLQTFLNQREMDNHSFGIELKTKQAEVQVLSPAGMKAFFGMETERDERGLRFEAFVLSVTSQEDTANYLTSAGVEFARIGNRLVVAPARGQGATIAFEERT